MRYRTGKRVEKSGKMRNSTLKKIQLEIFFYETQRRRKIYYDIIYDLIMYLSFELFLSCD